MEVFEHGSVRLTGPLVHPQMVQYAGQALNHREQLSKALPLCEHPGNNLAVPWLLGIFSKLGTYCVAIILMLL